MASTQKIPAACGRRKGETATRVDEYANAVDPVQGTASAYAAVYFLTPLRGGGSLVACVAESYAEGVWANGWALSAGNWGKPVRLQSGNRLYIAVDVSPSAVSAENAAGLGVAGVDAKAMRWILKASALSRRRY